MQKDLYIVSVGGGCTSLVLSAARYIRFQFQLLETLQMQKQFPVFVDVVELDQTWIYSPHNDEMKL